MGAKKNKVKKMLAPLTQPSSDISFDDDCVDDIFAVLDSRDQTVQQEPTVVSAQSVAVASEKSSSKSRFKARQVRLFHCDRSSLVTRLIPRQGK